MFSLLQAFPEAATFVLCVCQHAELGVSLAGHHLAHPAQPTARDPACGVPQAPRAPHSTGRAETHTLGLTHTFVLHSLSGGEAEDGEEVNELDLNHMFLPAHL